MSLNSYGSGARPLLSRVAVVSLVAIAAACGSSGDGASEQGTTAPSEDAGATTVRADAGASTPNDAAAAPADAGPDAPALPPCPSTGTWSSLIPGPGQAGYDAALAAKVAQHDRIHEALSTYATGLDSSGITITNDASIRQKLVDLASGKWSASDDDPTDDLAQYEGLDPATIASWQLSTGMYAGAGLAADAFRYGVLRDRGGDCNDVARARKMLAAGLAGLHEVVAITGIHGGIARGIARNDLAGDGKSTTTPLFDANNQPLPTDKNNGTWRADNSQGGQYPKLIWIDSCSRDMLFGWTFAMAAAWEVIANDPTVDPQTKATLQADAKSVLDGLMVVRSSGKDLEIWDPDGRRTYHGNLHETSVDRNYVLQNGPASMMALGEVAGLVSVGGDATAKAYLNSLNTTRGLLDSTNSSMFVVALGGDSSNHSAYNMLFMTAWMAHRYIDDQGVRDKLKKPTEQDLYAPIFGARPADWKQSFFDVVVAASSGDAWAGGPSKTAYDQNAIDRAVDTLVGYPSAPFFGAGVQNCDATEIAAGSCVLNDGVTTVTLKQVKWGLIADKPLPMKLRPPSNYYWRTDPYLVNGDGDPNAIMPAADLRAAYWMGRYVRVQ